MGIDVSTAKFLVWCRGNGVSFERTLTLGRQELYAKEPALESLFPLYGLPAKTVEVGTYSDGLFKALGAKDITAADASDFEGATLVHDMNLPLPRQWYRQFDTVFDGGSLEHIFNFPVAIRNCMEAVKIGGDLILHTPTNNYSGHGFYQFSPELFYRVLSPENGFRIERMIAYEFYPGSAGSQWYEVVDPKETGGRLQIASGQHRIILLVRARRISEAEIFRTPPQQSDYAATWLAANSPVLRTPSPSPRSLRRILADTVFRAIGDRTSVIRFRDARFLRNYQSLDTQPKWLRPVDL
jgi:SAM-dependent methyltransferase